VEQRDRGTGNRRQGGAAHATGIIAIAWTAFQMLSRLLPLAQIFIEHE
jgi:hypothetical protein